MIKLTPIKPRTTQQNLARVEAAIKEAFQQAAKELVEDFQKTTATWDHQPRPTLTISRQGVEARIDDKVWGMLDKGTRPHTIRARRAKALAFASGYTAKTRPDSLFARSGGPSGGTVFAREVQHPGTKPRRWSIRLKSKWKQKWPSMVNAGVARAIR